MTGWLVAAGAVLAAASVYAVPAAACRLMGFGRRRFTAPDAPAAPTAVVLLSGRVLLPQRDGRTPARLARTCLARVEEAARVYALIAPEWVISAGGVPRPETGVPTCAEMMRDELVRLGVPAGRVVTETESRTTRDQAVLVAAMLRRLQTPRAVIVTSDAHMPRALGAFRALGVAVAAAGAADADASRAWPAWILPTAHGLRFSREVAHELVGRVIYRLRGWQA